MSIKGPILGTLFLLPSSIPVYFQPQSVIVVYPKLVIGYDTNGLLHKNTILCDVIFLMDVIRKMIIRKYPIDGLKGQKQIAYGNAVGLGNI